MIFGIDRLLFAGQGRNTGINADRGPVISLLKQPQPREDDLALSLENPCLVDLYKNNEGEVCRHVLGVFRHLVPSQVNAHQGDETTA